MKLELWSGLLWLRTPGGPFAYCPEHRVRLDINWQGRLFAQASTGKAFSPSVLVCPTDELSFPIPGESFDVHQRRFLATLESLDLKDAEIVSIDGYQIPIAKATPPVKDMEYWAEVRINDTKRGKQLVVYAGKRGASDKTQIFIDPNNDKISFDQNNMHPNDVFTKLTAEFGSGKKTEMEE